MKTMQWMAVVILAVMAGTNAGAATYTAKTSGDWTSAATWTSNAVPSSGDAANVYSNFTVTLNNATNTGNSGALTIGGTTEVQGAGRLVVSGSGLLNLGSTTFDLRHNNSALVITTGGGVVSNVASIINLNIDGAQNGYTNISVLVDGANSRLSGLANIYISRGTSTNNYMVVSNGASASVGMAGTINAGYGANSFGSYLLVGQGGSVTGSLNVGTSSGAMCNYVKIADGGSLIGSVATRLGGTSGANTNYVMVTGTGSVWKTSAQIYVGANASAQGNYLWIENGGVLSNSTTINIGDLGAGANGNYMMITNGGVVYSADQSAVGQFAGANSNLVTITGTGSVWYSTIGNGRANIGNNGSYNGLIVTNGGMMVNGGGIGTGIVGAGTTGTGNYAIVTGPGSVWCNSNITVGASTGPGNSLTIANEGKILSSGVSSIGNAGTSRSNIVTVTDYGSVWSNNNNLYVGSGGHYNGLIVTNGGKVYCAQGGVNWLAGASNNYVIITDTGSVWSVSALTVGHASGDNNHVIITNGGTLYSTADSWVGGATAANSGYVIVSGAGSLWGHGARLYVGVSGNASSTGNWLRVEQGGSVTNITQLMVGVCNSGYNDGGNSVVLTSGGLLEVTSTIQVGPNNSVIGLNNYVTNSGGILQFTTAAPTITIYTNNGSKIVFDSGTLAYRGITNGTLPNLTNNTGTAQTGLFTWPAGTTNAFRLNSCTATNSQAGGYTFAYNASDGKQYARLEMVGTSELRGQPVTIGAGGTIYFDRTAAMLRSSLTLAAGAAIALGSTDAFSVTAMNGLAVSGAGTLVLPADLARDAEFKLISVSGSVPSAGTLRSWSDPAGKFRLELRNDTEVWVAPQPPKGTMIYIF